MTECWVTFNYYHVYTYFYFSTINISPVITQAPLQASEQALAEAGPEAPRWDSHHVYTRASL